MFSGKIAGYKSELFDKLRGKAKKVLEIGIGTGPNLKYYAGDIDVQVVGVDPNKKMEKYAQAAAMAAGLPLANFKFMKAVCLLISFFNIYDDVNFYLELKFISSATWYCFRKNARDRIIDGFISRCSTALQYVHLSVSISCHCFCDPVALADG